MATAVLTRRDFIVYSGNDLHEPTVGLLPVTHCTGGGTYARFASAKTFRAPLRVTFWLEWLSNLSPDGADYLGIHTQFVQDNDTNYDFGIRHDGRAVLLQENQSTYTRLSEFVTHDWRPDGERHQVSLLIGTEKMSLSADEVHDETDAFTPGLVLEEVPPRHQRFPRLHTGRIGFRLDRQKVNIGPIVVQEF